MKFWITLSLCSLTNELKSILVYIIIPQIRDENVIDNEGLGRKSSKRCCIFHKQRAFGESSTDSSDYDSDDNKKPIARKKKTSDIEKEKKKTPDHLRFHA